MKRRPPLHNPKLVTPFEAVTNMYAYPPPRGFDPNLLMAVFYHHFRHDAGRRRLRRNTVAGRVRRT